MHVEYCMNCAGICTEWSKQPQLLTVHCDVIQQHWRWSTKDLSGHIG